MFIKTKVIFLYADSLQRDFSACYILQEKLKEKGYKSFIFSRRNFKLSLKVFLPRKIFLIGQIDMINDKALIDKSYQEGLEIHFMPAEGFAYESEYVIMYPKENDYNFLKSIFFWGQNSMAWFKKNRKINNSEKLQCAGYSRFPIAESYAKIRSSRAPKKRIGFVGRFPLLNDIYGRSVMSFFVNEQISEEREKSFSRLEAESMAIKLYLNLFEHIISNTDYYLSLRAHPNEDTNTYKILKETFGERVEINNDFDVAEWISNCSKIVGLASSSFIDAYILKVPVICLDFMLGTSTITSKFDPALGVVYGCSHLPKTKDEVISLLLNANLKVVATEDFESLVESDFQGDTDLVFDRVLSTILSIPLTPSIIDSLILKVLEFMDYIFSTRLRLNRNNSLQFDFSYSYHSVSNSLKNMAKNIVNKI